MIVIAWTHYSVACFHHFPFSWRGYHNFCSLTVIETVLCLYFATIEIAPYSSHQFSIICKHLHVWLESLWLAVYADQEQQWPQDPALRNTTDFFFIYTQGEKTPLPCVLFPFPFDIIFGPPKELSSNALPGNQVFVAVSCRGVKYSKNMEATYPCTHLFFFQDYYSVNHTRLTS